MEYNNSRKSSLGPMIYVLVLITGIFIGNKILHTPEFNHSGSSFVEKSNKISALISLIETKYVDEIKMDSLEEIVLPEILEKLDPHSTYIPARLYNEINEPLKGEFDGIGVQFNIQNDTILIVKTIAGGPSEKVGVLAGDRIITINDSLFAGIGIKNKDVIKNLKGERGTEVKIGVKRKGVQELLYFTITRDKIPLYSVDVSYMVNKNTGYVKISNFAATTYEEFLEASQKLLTAGMENLILDLRNNGGGYLRPAVSIADEFLPSGKIIVETKGKNTHDVHKSTDDGICKHVKLAIIMDSWSASASEILAGAMQDNDRAIIIGRRSFGKGLVQQPFEFHDKSEVRLTIARYYTATGRCIQKPYEDSKDKYLSDIYHRAEHGELDSINAIDFPDSLKYTTPGGRTVYGGGGIMPDIFVPVDTSGITDYFTKLRRKGVIYSFSLVFADKNREKFKNFKNADELEKHLKSINLYLIFQAYAKSKGVVGKPADIRESEHLIKTTVTADICRNIFDDEAFYKIIEDIDTELLKAVESFSNN